MNKKYIAIGAGLFAAGAGTGFLVGRQVTIKKVEDWANDEIKAVRESFQNDVSRKEGVFATPQSAASVLIPSDGTLFDEEMQKLGRETVQQILTDSYGSETILVPSVEDRLETAESLQTVEEKEPAVDYTKFSKTKETSEQIEFPDADTIVDTIHSNLWDKTEARVSEPGLITEIVTETGFVVERHADRPYVITQAMFMENGGEYDDNKLSLMFFEEDGQLTDERDQLVPNVEELVGEHNMTRFGEGSEDRNIVYIRNEKIKADIEVVRDKRSFQEVVLNVKPEKQISRPPKLRNDDD
jgi:hypothetical protein